MSDLLLFTALVLAWWLIRRPPRKAGWVNLAQYYKTAHWQRVRRRKLAEGNGKCQKCGRGGRMEIHHIHYRSLHHEKLSDLQRLCPICHTRGPGKK